MNTDPIADLLTRIRNASRAGNKTLNVQHSRIKEEILGILEKEGYIEKARVDRTGKFPMLHITLLDQNEKIELKRLSKAGRRVYLKHNEIRDVRNDFGISIISTSKGIMTGKEAKKQGVGGEPICEIF